MDLDGRLWGVFVKALELDADTPREEVRFRNAAQWDSLGHMALVVAIEDEFAVQLTADQVVELDSYETARAILTSVVSPG